MKTDCIRLKKSNCKNCYKCIRHCPVKAIRFSAGQAHIIADECILCGQCFVVCPQNAKEIVDEIEKVKVLIQSRQPVYVSLAPSFAANYEGSGIEDMKEALLKLGFADVQETALGATMVKREYDRLLKEEGRDIVISSCCHSINLLIQKYYPKELEYLADVVSPMQAHCLEIKRQVPEAKTVFIGPCVAKKDESQQYEGIVDAVLTFEELTRWLKDEKIEIGRSIKQNDESLARFFPTTGGILKTMEKDAPDYAYLALDGVENCMAALKDIENGKIHHCFIEMSACAGSCIGGPVMEKYHRSPVRDYASISRYAGNKDFPVDQPAVQYMKKPFGQIALGEKIPSEKEITDILHNMGKYKPEDELNCGSCGYNTCREKAIAVFEGKAEISMCLPFLKEKAESLSNTIVRCTPNAVLVLNSNLEVQQLNNAALRILNLHSAHDILGDQVVRILEPDGFIQVRDTGRGIFNERVYLAEYDRFVDRTIVSAEEGRMILCIMKDVTEEENARREREEISRNTVDVADRVVEKQMRIVQEIASLLGETAAETKIALYKLKESITNE